MPEFDDPTQPPHYRPQLDYSPVSGIERYTVLLKDGETTATIYPIHSVNELPPGLLAFLCDEFNMEIERGDTFAFFDTLHIETFQNYWFGAFAAVMVLGDMPTLQGLRQWEKECLGTFFVKPNYPGRGLHICTAGFLVNAGIRGKGIGRTLADCYLLWAPRLGYTYLIFNLVFETNVAARRIWESLNFKRVGRVKSAGILKGHDAAVDAIMYGRELISTADPTVGAYRFDKIKFYLETGRYPAMADRLEKSRLRSSASHYRLENGKLMLKGREVVSDPVRQLQIVNEVHLANHGGINKTTAVIAEKYHWTRIKDTVGQAIKNCPECREPVKSQPVLKRPNLQKKSLLVMNGGPMGGKVGKHQPLDDEVDAMVAAAQLHNLPGRHDDALLGHDLLGLDDGIMAAVEAAQRSLHQPRSSRGTQGQQVQPGQQLLPRLPTQSLQLTTDPQLHGHGHGHTLHGHMDSSTDPGLQQQAEHRSYAAVAAAAVRVSPYSYDTSYNQRQPEYGVRPRRKRMAEAFDEGALDTEEIEIARVLINANDTGANGDENGDEKALSARDEDDEASIFFKPDHE